MYVVFFSTRNAIAQQSSLICRQGGASDMSFNQDPEIHGLYRPHVGFFWWRLFGNWWQHPHHSCSGDIRHCLYEIVALLPHLKRNDMNCGAESNVFYSNSFQRTILCRVRMRRMQHRITLRRWLKLLKRPSGGTSTEKKRQYSDIRILVEIYVVIS